MDLPVQHEVLLQPGPTRQLADFVANLRTGEIDAFARRAATRHLIDTLGAIIAGAPQDSTQAVAKAYARAGVGSGPIVVPGMATRFDALHATYIAGAAGHGLEVDDGYRPGSVHPGGVVVPAALSLAARTGASGEDLIRAIVAGYEAVCRIAAACHPRARWRGFHNTGIAGVFGSAAAAAVLLGFDADQVENTFGLAGSGAAGLFSFAAGGDVKRIHPGHAAREGLLAALLTEGGLAGPRGVLEFKEGFFNAFAGGDSGEKDYRAIDLLGTGNNNPKSPFAVANCYMKPHACCRHIHSAIDAVLDIAEAEAISAEDVETVRIGTYAVAASHAKIGWSEMTTAQMSFPFVIGIALTRGHVGLHDFDDAARHDATVLGLTRRIQVSTDAECDADYPRLGAARVELETKGGKRFSRYVPEPYGGADKPLSDAALDTKFLGLAIPQIGEAKSRVALGMLWGVETLPDVTDLAEALAG
ncbi:MmgE/PrpD family protein [Acidisphaera sp. L21]|uniref:MmgE/PrpD family protein n=1 Tax=Acidisphaera sp. L21 TaxID=1641851 RepID=UPI00131A9ADA|nr:MmgE/PrpD family protein [Acidisphaera sp. L21]